MGLDDIVKKAAEETEDEVIEIDKVDRGHGFRIKVDFEVPGQENDMRFNSYLSPYVEDTPWSRQELTNDKAREAVRTVIDKVREEHPDAEAYEATIYQRVEVREIDIL